MRVYLASTTQGLFESAPDTQFAFSPTPGLWHSLEHLDPDEDMVSQAALDLAAAKSLQLIGTDNLPRRVVIVAEIGSAQNADKPVPGALQLGGVGLEWSDVVCIYIDDVGCDQLIRSAQQGVAEAVAALREESLMWYDITEHHHLLEELSAKFAG